MSQHVRTGTNYWHIALKDIDKLGKFVNIGTAEEVSKFCFTRVINRSLFAVGFIVHFHWTEFVTHKIPTIQTGTHLLKEYRTGRSQLYDTSYYEINKRKNCYQKKTGENNVEQTFQNTVLHLTQRLITQIQYRHITHHTMPDTTRKTFTYIGDTMKIKQVVLTIIHDREIITSLLHRQRAKNMLDSRMGRHKIWKTVRITQIRTLWGKLLIRVYVKITYNLIQRGCQGILHLLIQYLHVITTSYKDGITSMFTLGTISYHKLTDDDAVNA